MLCRIIIYLTIIYLAQHALFLIFQTIYTRLNGWRGSIRTQPWERERHKRRQVEAVVTLFDQTRFLNVSFLFH